MLRTSVLLSGGVLVVSKRIIGNTGYYHAAFRCGVFSCEKGGQRQYSVVMLCLQVGSFRTSADKANNLASPNQ